MKLRWFLQDVRAWFQRLQVPYRSSESKYAEPVYPPAPPSELLSSRAHSIKLLSKRKYKAPPGEDDCPLYALYRIYEAVVLDRNLALRNTIEYFWNQHTWAVREIPDPVDDNPERYAVLACIPQMLVLAFNKNIELGLPRDAPPIMTSDEIDEFRQRERHYEAVPEWVDKVAPLPNTLRIPHKKDIYSEKRGTEVLENMDDERASDFFKKKNVLIWEPHFYFI